MHRSDGRVDLQAFRQLQEIGARNTASEHVVEGQSRHAHIDNLVTPFEKIVDPSKAGVLWVDQLTI